MSWIRSVTHSSSWWEHPAVSTMWEILETLENGALLEEWVFADVPLKVPTAPQSRSTAVLPALQREMTLFCLVEKNKKCMNKKKASWQGNFFLKRGCKLDKEAENSSQTGCCLLSLTQMRIESARNQLHTLAWLTNQNKEERRT